MTVKTISKVNTESIEVTISAEELAKLAHEKLMKVRPDLLGKPTSTHMLGNAFLFSSNIIIKVDVNL